MIVFFFKQKTAYEIGTGDWSSDVCSSDLRDKWIFNPTLGEKPVYIVHLCVLIPGQTREIYIYMYIYIYILYIYIYYFLRPPAITAATSHKYLFLLSGFARVENAEFYHMGQEGYSINSEDPRRSEEHTSELQSPVPISYAVFFLQKKKHQ